MINIDSVTAENFDQWYKGFKQEPRDARIAVVTEVCHDCAAKYKNAEMAMVDVARKHGKQDGSLLERIMFGYVVSRTR